MSIISVVWVLMITSHGHSQVMPYAYDSQQSCETEAKSITRKMDKRSKWECQQIVITADRAAMIQSIIQERKQEYR